MNRILQPVCLGGLISYFTPGQNDVDELDGYLYAAGIIVCSLVPVALFHPFTLYVMQEAFKVRVVCCSLMYSKVIGFCVQVKIKHDNDNRHKK